MIIENFQILNFKNISAADLSFSPEVNCFTGLNGSGKTNLLDAIYYLSLTKSALGLTDNQCIRHGEEFFMLSGRYIFPHSVESIVCSFKARSPKTLKRNGKDYTRFSEHIGLIPIVLSSPSDTSLISESGDERRRYLNAYLSQSSTGYLDLMMRYNNLLAQRNKILKSPNGFSDVIEVIDMQIADIGTQIFIHRQAHVTELQPLAQQLYAAISGGSESISVEYKSDLEAAPFSDLLLQAADRDRIMGHTTVGIHRDDIRLAIEELPIRKFGSQGQQKSMLLALKLAGAQLLHKQKNIHPILLLDDVFDKLDALRVQNLLQIVSTEQFGQIFLTDSNKVRSSEILASLACDAKHFNVESGNFNLL